MQRPRIADSIPAPRQVGVFELQCHSCDQTVEISVDTVMDGGPFALHRLAAKS